MANIPKKWILAHKRAEQAYKFLADTKQHLIKYLKQNHINDLYDLHKHYVPIDRYQHLQHKYLDLKKSIDQETPKQREAIVGKAKIQADHQRPYPSINQLKKDQENSNS